jgi:hypothetical protein
VYGNRERLFNRLTDITDRLIVDTNTSRASFHRTIEGLLKRRHHCAPTDLNWTRLDSWRELVAQFFDNVALRSYLGRIDALSIEFGSPPKKQMPTYKGPERRVGNVMVGDPSRALLLFGWLAGRLGWRLADCALVPKNGTVFGHISMMSQDRAVSVEIRPQKKAPADGVLMLVELTAGNDAIFRVSRPLDDVDHVGTELIVGGGAPIRRIIRLDEIALADSLAIELALFDRDHVYEEAVRIVSEVQDRFAS